MIFPEVPLANVKYRNVISKIWCKPYCKDSSSIIIIQLSYKYC